MNRILFLFIIFVFICSSYTLFSNGQSETQIQEARQLYDEKKYDDALEILGQIVARNDNQFEAAIDLATRINNIKNDFNNNYQALITSLKEGQVDLALQIIERINTRFPYLSEKQISIISEANNKIEAVAMLNRFNEIMDQGLEFLKSFEFYKALDKYYSGFSLGKSAADPIDLFRSDFYALEIGNIQSANISQFFNIIDNNINQFQKQGKIAETKSKEFLAALNEPQAENYNDFIDDLLGEFQKSLAIGEEISTAADNLKLQAESLRETLNNPESLSYLKYCYYLSQGRENIREKEGIVESIKAYIDGLALDLIKSISKKSTDALQTAIKSFGSANEDQSQILFNNAASLNRVLLPLSYYYDTHLFLERADDIELYAKWELSNEYLFYMDAQEALQLSLSYLDLLSSKTTDSQNQADLANPSVKVLESIYNNASNFDSRYRQMATFWNDYIQKRKEYNEIYFDDDQASALVKILTKAIQDSYDQYLAAMDAIYRQQKNRLPNVLEFLETGSPHPQFGVVYYTDQGLSSLEDIESNLDYILKQINYFNSTWDKTPELKEQASIVQLLKKLNSLEQLVMALYKEIQEPIKSAEDKIRTAQKHKNLGIRKYNSASTAYGRLDYLVAKEELQIAADEFYESLKFQEDPEVRDFSESRVLALGKRIKELENQRVIIQARQFVRQGKELYGRGFFNDALDLLYKARALLQETQTQEDPEITTWINIVEKALSIDKDRSIAETNPLYKVMSQLFNLAKSDYNTGILLYNNNDKEAAMMKFENATEKLLTLQQEFPYNEDAGVLQLYILQKTNPPEFNSHVQEAKNEGQEAIKTSSDVEPGPTKKKEAYNKLKTLEALLVSDKDITAMILELEYQLGIKQRPLSAFARNESNRLVNQAKTIIDSRDTFQFPAAKTLLSQALSLNPNNDAAVNLLNAMLFTEGVQPDVLASTDRRMIEEAEQAYINGDKLRSQELCLELWSKAKLRGDQTLINLVEKLEAEGYTIR
ncbi:MAG: hypothetical protein JXR70_12395 [Spirochaetales bacterium]|nr:hypothetical protein [Spirochaetales bacterium]